jgi:hypothetical protein
MRKQAHIFKLMDDDDENYKDEANEDDYNENENKWDIEETRTSIRR